MTHPPFAKPHYGKFLGAGVTGTAQRGARFLSVGGASLIRRAKTAADARNIDPRSQSSPTAFYGNARPTLTPNYPQAPQTRYPYAPARPPAAPAAPPAPPRRPEVRQPGVDPYAPLTDAQIGDRAKTQIDALTAPILKQIADMISARSTAGQQAITGYTTRFGPALQQLAGIGTAGLDTGIQSQTAVDSALQQALTGAGGTAASELGAKLAQINAPQADQQTAAQTGIGVGSGNAALASGSAALSALIAQRANAADQASKEPGIAALYGGQATRDLQAQASRDLADQTGKVTSQVPGLIQSTLADLRANEFAKAGARATQGRFDTEQSRLTHQFDVGQTNARANARIAAGARVTAAGLAADAANGRAKESRLRTLIGLKTSNERSSGYQWQVAPDGSGVRPVDGDPRKPGVQTVETSAQVAADAKATSAGQPKTPGEWRARIAQTATVGGGYDPQTGSITEALRQQIIDATGQDPGLTVTRQQAVAAGWAKAAKAAKKDPKLAPNPSVTRSSNSKVLLDGYGHTYDSDPKAPGVQPIKAAAPKVPASQTPAGKAAAKAKAKTSALKAADKAALSVVTSGSKKAGVYGETPKTNAFGDIVKDPATGKPVMVRTRTGDRYSASYYETIHRIEAAVEDQLGPYMSRSDIIRFAQKYANQYYPEGKGGRPKVGVHGIPGARKNAPSGDVTRSPLYRKPKPRPKANAGAPADPFGLGPTRAQ